MTKHYSRFRKAGYSKISSRYLERKVIGNKSPGAISISKTLKPKVTGGKRR